MIKQFTFNHFEVNCYLIVDEATRQCAIVDPACEASFEDAQLTQYIEAEGLQVTHILLTHAHVDHIAGLRQCCEHYGLPVTMHAEGIKLLRQAEAYGSLMGFAVDNMGDLKTSEINDDDLLHVGNLEVECRYVPGHCPGSMCFVLPADKAVITGDALFHFSIGRTDLPGGDYPTLIDYLKRRILTLPDDYCVLPGHGIASQIGKERKYNSFLV
ncbi:MAG: MBL fold metallo-hydrolase [Bacteroidales bacterium]|nr:MBL fold metallo-hydrolase [Bacteroidales bacterium]